MNVLQYFIPSVSVVKNIYLLFYPPCEDHVPRLVSFLFFYPTLFAPPPGLGAVPSGDSGGAAVFSDLNPQILSVVCGESW